MKFFFADSQDMVDPTFDFETEERADWRIRQRDDLYPHEILQSPPYDGLLVSKSVADGNGNSSSRYSLAQRQRFRRNGVHAFFRTGHTLETMGDCGAFSYVREDYPPVTSDEVIDFYETCGFDLGISVDHIILGFQPEADGRFPRFDDIPVEWRRRQEITLEFADEFLRKCRALKVRFSAMGVAQGWSPDSYANSVVKLQAMGYKRIAVGGMVPLKTAAILQCVEAIDRIREPGTSLHLLGVTRLKYLRYFEKFGVTSFDTTSPLRQAFMDNKNNYYTKERNYQAIRVPQVEGNPRLQERIRSGELNQEKVRKLELSCLQALVEYDRETLSLDVTLEHVLAYQRVYQSKEDRYEAYRQVLRDRPWASCTCNICQKIGIHVIIFRGAERNKRRGFHNLRIFFDQVQEELSRTIELVELDGTRA